MPLRNSKLSEIGSRDVDEEHGDSWAVAASLKYGNEITNLGTSYDPLSNEKRKANINGQGFDVFIDNTGIPEVIELGYKITNDFGRIILVGVPTKNSDIKILNIAKFFEKLITDNEKKT